MKITANKFTIKEIFVRREFNLKLTLLKKSSQLMATLLLTSVLIPVIASAATYITKTDYNFTTGTITGTVYSDVYYPNASVGLTVYPNTRRADSIPITTFSATYDAINSIVGATYFDFTATIAPRTDVPFYLEATYNSINSDLKQIFIAKADGGSNGDGSPISNLTDITFDAPSYTLLYGQSSTAVVTATYSDNTKPIVTPFTSFSFSDASVASITSSGVITGNQVGNTVLTATYSGKTVTASVYVRSSNNSSNNPGGGGGSSISNGAISVSSDGFIDANTLTSALTAGDTTLKLSGTTALLPASALVANGSKTITITNDSGTYMLPVSVLNLDALAKALGIEVKDLKIKVTITKAASTTSDAVKAAATAEGATQLADAVDFNVVGIDKDSKTTPADFGKTYVSRSVNVSSAVDTSKATGVLYNETTKKVSFVPAIFTTTDGKTTATLKRNGNSVYTVVYSNKSFADVASHWSKADVELLANKLVVEGSTATTFEPERNITRAEFAALAVRSLGLTGTASASTFKDVKSDAWYASSVATATYAGIINGYEDNTFRPDAAITREELAAIVIRAMDYASISTSVADPQAVLSKFKDANNIVWAQKEVAAAVNAGIINGLTDDTIGSTNKATRAQSATMLKRFLSTAKFIN